MSKRFPEKRRSKGSQKGLPSKDDPLTDEEIAALPCPPGIMSVDDDDPESVKALIAELERRMANFESGRSKGIPAEEVFRELRRSMAD